MMADLWLDLFFLSHLQAFVLIEDQEICSAVI